MCVTILYICTRYGYQTISETSLSCRGLTRDKQRVYLVDTKRDLNIDNTKNEKIICKLSMKILKSYFLPRSQKLAVSLVLYPEQQYNMLKIAQILRRNGGRLLSERTALDTPTSVKILKVLFITVSSMPLSTRHQKCVPTLNIQRQVFHIFY